jgi:hypothetical protein
MSLLHVVSPGKKSAQQVEKTTFPAAGFKAPPREVYCQGS